MRDICGCITFPPFLGDMAPGPPRDRVYTAEEDACKKWRMIL